MQNWLGGSTVMNNFIHASVTQSEHSWVAAAPERGLHGEEHDKSSDDLQNK